MILSTKLVSVCMLLKSTKKKIAESRQAQYLRILTEGPQKTLSDAEVAQWLIDEGYAKGHIRDLSHLRHPTDADVKYVWQGVTHEGRIFIERLKVELAEMQKPQGVTYDEDSRLSKNLKKKKTKPVSPFGLRAYLFTISAGLIILIIWELISP